MPFIRQRITKAGTVSTALVESYRDDNGRPRQRLLANLHGEPDALRALAKLIVLQENLMREMEELVLEEANTRGKERGPLLQRILKVHAQLKTIEKDGPAVEKHCTATEDEIEAAIETYRQELRSAACVALGMTFHHTKEIREAEAKVRRMTT